MKRYTLWRLTLALLFCLSFGAAASHRGYALSSSSAQAANPSEQSQPPSAQTQPENPNSATSQELTKESGEVEENTQFKYSPTVRWFAKAFGIDVRVMYWISYLTNFLLVVVFFYFLFRSKLPQAFRDRTATIQKGIKEAQAASADAARRLSDIEARLGKLDTEVAEIRASAERESAAEEERIRQAAEEDKKKVVAAAEAEIEAIARNARRELKGYAASLAVDLAARRIRVDESTDHGLVREFVEQLGKDGK
ncbi:MAG: ATP synthase F0 subunit B [Candidatus Korobacteraceae bacterium]